MGVKIKVLARTEDGQVRTYTANDACYRSIGKSSAYLSSVQRSLGDASPVTLTHENMANNLPVTVSDKHVEVFAKLWDIIPALRTCISTPQEILSSGRATFDVANYSLNEVMVAMFFMRTLVNNHANQSRNWALNLGSNNLVQMVTLMGQRGWSWEKSYMFCLCPRHNDSYATQQNQQPHHLDLSDASCLLFNRLKDKTMFQFLRGEYEGWDYCNKSYRKILDKASGYTQNIRKQVVSPSGEKGTWMSVVFADLAKAGMAGGVAQETTDLFGKTITSERVGSLDYVDAWGEAYDKLEGEIDA